MTGHHVPGYRDDVRQPWGSMPLAELIDRLEAISAYHRTDDDVHAECLACDNPYPCLTWKMAAGAYLLEDGSE